MSLSSLKRLLGDGQSTYDAYLPILTTRIFRALQRFMMAVRNNGEGVRNVIPDARNENVNVCDIVVSGRNCCICLYSKFLLGAAGQQ